MKNIHVIPTSSPSRLYFDTDLQSYELSKEVGGNNSCSKNQYLYITNSEEPKLDEWGINLHNNVIFNCKGFASTEETKKYNRKIILTNDQTLIVDGVQAIDNKFLEWFVKNTSCEEVEVEIIATHPYSSSGKEFGAEEFFKANSKYQIIIPQEEPKQMLIVPEGYYDQDSKDFEQASLNDFKEEETLEEAAENFANSKEWLNGGASNWVQFTFKEGAEWQANRMYNEVFEWLGKKDYLTDEVDILRKEFEQHKKK
jgi:hypothetical protein